MVRARETRTLLVSKANVSQLEVCGCEVVKPRLSRTGKFVLVGGRAGSRDLAVAQWRGSNIEIQNILTFMRYSRQP
jgi:hypothetical protein